MKHLLLSLALLTSANAWADDELPDSLYCSLGSSYVELHFNDEGEDWFKIHDSRYEILESKRIIKKLNVTPRMISFNHRCGVSCGAVQFKINRLTGGIQSGYDSGQCSTSNLDLKRKF